MYFGAICESGEAAAPIRSDSNVNSFAKLEADLSRIPQHGVKKLIWRMQDGDEHYVFNGACKSNFWLSIDETWPP